MKIISCQEDKTQGKEDGETDIIINYNVEYEFKFKK